MFKTKPIIIILIISLCAVIILLAHFQFFQARESTVKLYSEKQTILAKQVALSIEKFFQERTSALEVIAENIAANPGSSKRYREYFRNIFEKIGSYEYILFLDADANIVVTYPAQSDSLLALKLVFKDEIIQFYKNDPARKNAFVCDHAMVESGENFICIRVPVYNADNKFIGLILGVIALDVSMNNIMSPTIKQKDVHTFIVSREGHVLFHASHPEMRKKNIIDDRSACLRCHHNFEIEERMMTEESGSGEKVSKGGEKKLLSFARIHLAGAQWAVGIDMSYDTITETNSTQFIVFFLLSLSMMLVVIFGSIALYRVNREKLLIEEKHDKNRREHLAFIGEMSTRIAHEIKNPLASLQAGIQLLEANLPEDRKTTEYFQKLTSEVQRVDRIVKGLLSYSREEHLSKQDVNLVILAEKVVELNKQSIHDKVISWDIQHNGCDPVIHADMSKIEQVLWNLIINAIQAIKDEGEIKIAIAETKSGMLACQISDNGRGIPEAVFDKLYKPFFSTKTQGTGLGLAISKKIILAHEGTLDIKSTVDVGTTVSFALPR